MSAHATSEYNLLPVQHRFSFDAEGRPQQPSISPRSSLEQPLHTPMSSNGNGNGNATERKTAIVNTREGNTASHVHKSRGRFFDTANDWWALEIATGILSIACTIAIVVVLGRFHGRPLSDWHSYLQPNTIVSILATVAKSSLLLPVAECISQAKWLYFQQPQPLKALQKFDSASRGPLGAVEILFTVKGVLAWLGALITLAALGFDPFIQQVLSFKSQEVPVDSLLTHLPISQSYDSGVRSFSSEPQDYYPMSQAVDVSLTGATFQGLYNATLNSPYQCTAPTCQYPTFTTLGVCSTCTDVSKSLVRNCGTIWDMTYGDQCNYTTPANTTLTVNYINGPHTFNATLFDSSATYHYSGDYIRDMSIFNFSSIKMDRFTSWPPPDPASAYDCSLRWCGKTYSGGANVTNTTYTTTSSVTEWDFVNFTAWNYQDYNGGMAEFQNLIPDPSVQFNTSIQPSLASSNWSINYFDWTATSALLAGLFTTSSNLDVSSLLYRSPSIPQTLENIATSMTNTIRTSQNSTTVPGQAFQSQTFIQVRWEWLILPVLVVLAANVLLALMIWTTHSQKQIPVWKSSSLALMYHGFEARHHDDSGNKPTTKTARLSEMESSAASETVRLIGPTRSELRFVRA